MFFHDVCWFLPLDLIFLKYFLPSQTLSLFSSIHLHFCINSFHIFIPSLSCVNESLPEVPLSALTSNLKEILVRSQSSSTHANHTLNQKITTKASMELVSHGLLVRKLRRKTGIWRTKKRLLQIKRTSRKNINLAPKRRRAQTMMKVWMGLE
jgi:hypothetical protein